MLDECVLFVGTTQPHTIHSYMFRFWPSVAVVVFLSFRSFNNFLAHTFESCVWPELEQEHGRFFVVIKCLWQKNDESFI